MYRGGGASHAQKAGQAHRPRSDPRSAAPAASAQAHEGRSAQVDERRVGVHPPTDARGPTDKGAVCEAHGAVVHYHSVGAAKARGGEIASQQLQRHVDEQKHGRRAAGRRREEQRPPSAVDHRRHRPQLQNSGFVVQRSGGSVEQGDVLICC